MDSQGLTRTVRSFALKSAVVVADHAHRTSIIAEGLQAGHYVLTCTTRSGRRKEDTAFRIVSVMSA